MVNFGTGTWARYEVESVEWRTACKEVRASAGRLVNHDTDASEEELRPVCARLGIQAEEALRVVVCMSRDGRKFMVWVQEAP